MRVVDESTVRALVTSRWPGDDIVDCVPIDRGATNEVWRVDTGRQPLIVKLSPRPDRIARGTLVKEAQMLRRFGERLTIIPTLLASGATEAGIPYLVETVLPGEHFDSLLPTLALADRVQFAEQLGTLLAAIHTEMHPTIDDFEPNSQLVRSVHEKFRQTTPAWFDIVERSQYVPAPILNRAREQLTGAAQLFTDDQFVLNHGDFDPDNLLVARGKIVGLVDFENVRAAPREYDLASLEHTLFHRYPEMRTRLLATYAAVHPLSSTFAQRLRLFRIYRALRYLRRSISYNHPEFLQEDLEQFTAAVQG